LALSFKDEFHAPRAEICAVRTRQCSAQVLASASVFAPDL
jgi:hypothetical protein